MRAYSIFARMNLLVYRELLFALKRESHTQTLRQSSLMKLQTRGRKIKNRLFSPSSGCQFQRFSVVKCFFSSEVVAWHRKNYTLNTLRVTYCNPYPLNPLAPYS